MIILAAGLWFLATGFWSQTTNFDRHGLAAVVGLRLTVNCNKIGANARINCYFIKEQVIKLANPKI